MTGLSLKRICIGFMVSLGSLVASSGAGEPDPLRVGMELKYPPFEMKDSQGFPTGVSVDLAKALGEKLGRSVEILDMSFDGLIPALQTGRIDLVISSLTITEERARVIDFSEPYVHTGLSLLVASKSEVKAVGDLRSSGKVAVVKAGTTGHLFARKELRQATVRVFDDVEVCVLEVLQGKADAFLYDQLTVWRYHQLHPQETRALLEPFQKESWGIGIAKGREVLKAEIDAFLHEFRESGGFDALAERYLREEKAWFEAQGVTFLF